MLATTEEANEYRKKFHQYYYDKIVPALSGFEEERKAELKKYIFWFGFTIFLVIPFYLLHLYLQATLPHDVYWGIQGDKNSWNVFSFVFWGGIISVAASGLKAHNVKKDFENKIKKNVIDTFLKFFGSFIWNPNEYIDTKELVDSALIQNSPSLYVENDDYFEGTFKGVKFAISELEVIIKGKKSESTIFDGAFIRVGIQKQFSGHTVIMEDFSVKNIISCLARPLTFPGLSKTEFEDPEFNKMFDVHTNNEVDARYIITPSFIERYKKLKEVFNAKEIRASLKNNNLLIGLSINKDLFVLGDVRKPITDAGEIQTLFEQFMAVLSIVDILNLDSKTGL